MESLAELQDALVNADKAGDVDAARQIADAIHSMGKVQDAKPMAVQAGEKIGGIPRQLGLTARYGLEGLAQMAQIGTEPIRHLQDMVTPDRTPTMSQLVTGERTPKSTSLVEQATKLADWIGLPSPDGANERVVGDAARLVAGAGGLGAAGRLAQGIGGMVGRAGEFFASNPLQQAASAGGAGLAGGSVREAGGGPWSQAGAALAGGLAGPAALSGVQTVVRGATNASRRLADALAPGVPTQQNIDHQISLTLQRQGVDWAAVPERIKQPMRQEVARALDTGGELNPDALRRLLDFRRTGATPTRGMLTQDPVQITQEMNLAKTGANSTDIGLQRLPSLQNQNTSRLLSLLDDAGARGAPDDFATGQRVIDALNSGASASRGRIDSLYSAARDTSGRSAPLDGSAFTTRANQLIDEGLLGGALPESVAGHMNRIARGEVPFTVDYAEQLKTNIGKLQRATSDGQQRMALGVVRRALDETPLQATPNTAAMGQESIQAFNRARQANRAFMQRVESTPALAAALDGAQPDRFVRQFIVGQGASAADVQALRRALVNNPQAMEAVRSNIVSHLRDAATNSTEDVAKFSPHAYAKALNNIGDRKLAAFFSPEEIQQLHAVRRVGTLMNAQPSGTAVNNSNSGALVLGRALSALDAVAGKMPLGLNTMIQGSLRGVQQGQAMNVPRSLIQPTPPVPISTRLGVPAIYGGLLATQPSN